MDFLGAFVFGAFVAGGVGFVIGNVKGNGTAGLLLGFLLGPLGWLITLLIPDDRAKCPLCKGALPSENVSRCMHCGGAVTLGRRPGGPVRRARRHVATADPVEAWEAKQRQDEWLSQAPQVPEHLRGRKEEE